MSLGDWQTPTELAERVWGVLGRVKADLIFEPTVGSGNFIAAAPPSLSGSEWLGVDRQRDHVVTARQVAKAGGLAAEIHEGDIFDLPERVRRLVSNARRVLVVGNPPWVTVAAQSGKLANRPTSNRRLERPTGLGAITGESNFDIAEAVVLEVLSMVAASQEATIALLVKRSVALRVGRMLATMQGLRSFEFSDVDCKRWFGAAVDGGLMVIRLSQGHRGEPDFFFRQELGSSEHRVGGVVNGTVVADLATHRATRHVLAGPLGARFTWRQGLKHDLSAVMELHVDGCVVRRRNGERVDIEPQVLHPLFKSSDLAHGREPRFVVPLYQRDLSGPCPATLEAHPRLAAYLRSNLEAFRGRRSRIYVGKPDFTLFGVGDYTFSDWKVAVSGMYMSPTFRVLGPRQGLPSVVDDTCYLLPCSSEAQADAVAEYLNGADVQRWLLASLVRGSKRPLTKRLLDALKPPSAFTGSEVQLALA